MKALEEGTDLTLDFDKLAAIGQRVVPVVLQHADSNEVLYVAYTNETALRESLETRRKRLAFRARHCGTKEMDLLIGGFVERHIADLGEAQLDRFEALLELPEPLIARWVTGQEAPPPEYDDDVMRLLQNFKYTAPGC